MLLDDDKEWYRCMREAADTHMPYALRNLFVSILTDTTIQNVRELFNEFAIVMTEDFTFKERQRISK